MGTEVIEALAMLLVIVLTFVIATVWLKRKARKRRMQEEQGIEAAAGGECTARSGDGGGRK